METKTKRATKSAMNEFCTTNNISVQTIIDIFNELYPNIYCIDEDFAYNKVLKPLFKKYDIVSNTIITKEIVDLVNSTKIDYLKFEEIERNKKLMMLEDMLSNIAEEVKIKPYVSLKECQGYSKELMDLIKEEYGHWSVYDDNNEFSYGKVFHALFRYRIFEHGNVPFHCYATKDKSNVIFTRYTTDYIETKECYRFELFDLDGYFSNNLNLTKDYSKFIEERERRNNYNSYTNENYPQQNKNEKKDDTDFFIFSLLLKVACAFIFSAIIISFIF